MTDLWQDAMDHAVSAARGAGQVCVCVCVWSISFSSRSIWGVKSVSEFIACSYINGAFFISVPVAIETASLHFSSELKTGLGLTVLNPLNLEG